MIYDLYTNEYTEYSKEDCHPYGQVEFQEKFYLGPTYYFYKTNGIIKDLISNKELDQEVIECLIEKETEIKEIFLQSKNVEKNQPNTRSTNYVPDAYYFENDTTFYGTNGYPYAESCSYVAVGILLSYYDTFLNDNIINDYYDRGYSEVFSDYYSLDTSSYDISPGIDDDFHSYLINLGRGAGYTAYNECVLDYFQIDNFVEDYFDDLYNISVSVTTASYLYVNKTKFCKDAIDAGYPLIVGIYDFDELIDGHSVVVYGYENNDIIAHFGWNGYCHSAINPYYYAVAHYFDISASHVHSDNYTCQIGSGSNKCSGSMCPCGRKLITHTSASYNSLNNTSHSVYCSKCDYVGLEQHTYVYSGGNQVCSKCGHINGTKHLLFLIPQE